MSIQMSVFSTHPQRQVCLWLRGHLRTIQTEPAATKHIRYTVTKYYKKTWLFSCLMVLMTTILTTMCLASSQGNPRKKITCSGYWCPITLSLGEVLWRPSTNMMGSCSNFLFQHHPSLSPQESYLSSQIHHHQVYIACQF